MGRFINMKNVLLQNVDKNLNLPIFEKYFDKKISQFSHNVLFTIVD